MKAYSLSQPYALFAAHGYKTIIDAPVDTNHRGWVAIHASKEWNNGTLDVWPTADVFLRIDLERRGKGWTHPWDVAIPFNPGPEPKSPISIEGELPLGAIVGVAWLAKVERTNGLTERWNRREDAWKLDQPDYNDVSAWEPSWGDYSRGRFAWWLTHPVALRTPIPAQGFTGLWDTDDRAGDIDVRMALDIAEQGIVLPDNFDPGFFRLINRRGETVPTRPRNM